MSAVLLETRKLDKRYGGLHVTREVSLQLQHVTSIPPNDLGLRIGCEWLRLAGDAERALQRYIDQTQKRRRLLAQSGR